MQENIVGEKNMLKLESTHIYWHLEAELKIHNTDAKIILELTHGKPVMF